MILRRLNLSNFRNFNQKEFVFNPFLTLIVGENARGKTNLLEALYVISNGTGFRETKEEELISFKKNQAVLEAVFGVEDLKLMFKVVLKKKISQTEKSFFIDKAKKSFSQYFQEILKTVLFSPDQISLVTGSPEKRRRYIDKILSFYDLKYKKSLFNYESALRKRNKILETYIDEASLMTELSFWNQYLKKQASYITAKRFNYVGFLNRQKRIDNQVFTIKYVKNELTEKRLREVFEREKQWRRTLIGPQRDDFILSMAVGDGEEKNIHLYGSRSEQRLAVFWLKVNEVKYHQEKTLKKPLILLDDIFSELDQKNKRVVLNFVKRYQTVITTTDITLVDLIEVPKTVIPL